MGRLPGFAQIVALLLRQTGVQQQMAHAQNGVHGRADFMAHAGQEIAFGSGARFRLILGQAQRPVELAPPDARAQQNARRAQGFLFRAVPLPFPMAVVKADKAPDAAVQQNGRHQQGKNALRFQDFPLFRGHPAHQARYGAAFAESALPGGQHVVIGDVFEQFLLLPGPRAAGPFMELVAVEAPVLADPVGPDIGPVHPGRRAQSRQHPVGRSADVPVALAHQQHLGGLVDHPQQAVAVPQVLVAFAQGLFQPPDFAQFIDITGNIALAPDFQPLQRDFHGHGIARDGAVGPREFGMSLHESLPQFLQNRRLGRTSVTLALRRKLKKAFQKILFVRQAE